MKRIYLLAFFTLPTVSWAYWVIHSFIQEPIREIDEIASIQSKTQESSQKEKILTFSEYLKKHPQEWSEPNKTSNSNDSPLKNLGILSKYSLEDLDNLSIQKQLLNNNAEEYESLVKEIDNLLEKIATMTEAERLEFMEITYKLTDFGPQDSIKMVLLEQAEKYFGNENKSLNEIGTQALKRYLEIESDPQIKEQMKQKFQDRIDPPNSTNESRDEPLRAYP